MSCIFSEICFGFILSQHGWLRGCFSDRNLDGRAAFVLGRTHHKNQMSDEKTVVVWGIYIYHIGDYTTQLLADYIKP